MRDVYLLLIFFALHVVATWVVLGHFLNKARVIFLDIIKDPATIAVIREALATQLPAPFAAMVRGKD